MPLSASDFADGHVGPGIHVSMNIPLPVLGFMAVLILAALLAISMGGNERNDAVRPTAGKTGAYGHAPPAQITDGS